VVSIDSFERYQRERAAAWERQALTRARPVAGSAALAEDAHALVVRYAFLSEAPPLEEVAAMRRRMEVELAGERPGRYHPKLGYGGLVDVEFVVQWFSMRHGDDPTVRLANTRAALRALRAAGYLSEDDAHVLTAGQSFFRSVGQALSLLDESAEPVVFEGGRYADRISRRLGLRDRDGERKGEVLFSTWRRHAEAVRSVFERIIAPVGTTAPWSRG
jgi:glutamate-ammonia-ligase adenylyltransferase